MVGQGGQIDRIFIYTHLQYVARWYQFERAKTTTVRPLEQGQLEEDYPITTVFENEGFSSFFGKRTNNIHEFEGRFLRGQVSSNSVKVFNGCIVEP